MNFSWYVIVLLLYLAVINVISAAVTALDKYRAVHRKFRIKESTLLILSALGGSVSMYITMQAIRHKTKKLKFMLGIPAIFVLQVIAVVAAVILIN